MRIRSFFSVLGVLLLGACDGLIGDSTSSLPPGIELEPPEEIEPEVVIIQREDKTIEEYRVNGQLYMIKVIPKNAPSYFLVDSDGNGSLDARRSDLEPDLMIPNWVLFRW